MLVIAAVSYTLMHFVVPFVAVTAYVSSVLCTMWTTQPVIVTDIVSQHYQH